MRLPRCHKIRRWAFNLIVASVAKYEKYRLHAIGMNIEFARKQRAIESTAKFVDDHLLSARSFHTPREVLNYALARVRSSGDGLVLEFGVFRGESLTIIHDHLKRDVYGFDSFEGLPEDWIDGHHKGYFAVDALPVVPPGVHLVKGWFVDTLPQFVRNNLEYIDFLHIDSDLYSSAETIFQSVGERLRAGSVIVFDDFFNYPGWEAGEAKAFFNYINKSQRPFKYIAYCSNHMQVAVEITG